MSNTFFVLKLVKSIEVKDIQPVNIPFIFITFSVLKLNFKFCNKLHPVNKLDIS